MTPNRVALSTRDISRTATQGVDMNTQGLATHVARRSGTGPATRRNFTQELKRAQGAGRVVVGSMAGPAYEQPMTYAPRSKSDPSPWSYTDRHGCEWRYTGRECHAVAVCGQKLLSFRSSRFVPCTLPTGHDKAHRSA